MSDRPRAKRSLSQNFLVDPNLQRKVVAELSADPGDLVLEVGPGHGELGQHLVDRVHALLLVEKDRDLAAELQRRWGGRPDVEVIESDALAADLLALINGRVPYRVISNVPYNITSPLVFAFLDLDPAPVRIVVTVQKEVALRMVAAPGSRTYGALSVGVQARARAALAFSIGRNSFRPIPDVDSAVVRIEPDPVRLEGVDVEAVRRLTRTAFGQRRKQLQKILRTSPEYRLDAAAIDAACARLDLDPSARPERLSPTDYVELAAILEPLRGR